NHCQTKLNYGRQTQIYHQLTMTDWQLSEEETIKPPWSAFARLSENVPGRFGRITIWGERSSACCFMTKRWPLCRYCSNSILRICSRITKSANYASTPKATPLSY